MKGRTRPRLEHLRRLTGRNWGLDERQLRTVANGYVRGALEHAAAAWLPATPPSHVEVLEREMREAARIITGCTRSTPVHALMAEAGLTVDIRVITAHHPGSAIPGEGEGTPSRGSPSPGGGRCSDTEATVSYRLALGGRRGVASRGHRGAD